MPHFTQTFTKQAPLVDVVIGVSHARMMALQQAGKPIPAVQRVRGLVDTGASHTCIDSKVFVALGLLPTGTVHMHTPSTGAGTTVADAFDVSLILTGPQSVQEGLTLPNLRVSASELSIAQGFHVLLGRDVLAHCVFTYNGTLGWITVSH